MPTIVAGGEEDLRRLRPEDCDRRADLDVVAGEAATLLDVVAVHRDVVGADAGDLALLVGELRTHAGAGLLEHR